MVGPVNWHPNWLRLHSGVMSVHPPESTSVTASTDRIWKLSRYRSQAAKPVPVNVIDKAAAA